MADDQTVFVVDDDELARISVCALVRSMGVNAESFGSAEEFLDRYKEGQAGCLVTDVRMLGMSGLELQERLRELDIRLPVIVMTAYAKTPLTVRAMQGGALTLLEKPCEEDVLWDAIRKALLKDADDRVAHQRRKELCRRIESLTPAQRKVMDMIVAGKANKVIARDLDISVRTVEARRSEVFEKMQADSVAELVQLVIAATTTHSP